MFLKTRIAPAGFLLYYVMCLMCLSVTSADVAELHVDFDASTNEAIFHLPARKFVNDGTVLLPVTLKTKAHHRVLNQINSVLAPDEKVNKIIFEEYKQYDKSGEISACARFAWALVSSYHDIPLVLMANYYTISTVSDYCALLKAEDNRTLTNQEARMLTRPHLSLNMHNNVRTGLILESIAALSAWTYLFTHDSLANKIYLTTSFTLLALTLLVHYESFKEGFTYGAIYRILAQEKQLQERLIQDTMIEAVKTVAKLKQRGFFDKLFS